ncbi:DMT family transporter [Rubrobacter taiwanensis]|jgi:drug/metabolite transporter (DMT)-like permease|uniref:DMT family transporter n=1 Tax=Rubrobacter taiwanensis TaxID=185139 RepID=A0A4R1BQM5_9ACTN|nr:DMT family transporter [Rubrobacter taiwanensis]TCJ20049.1 DMT family transporter [Rubrobacter taiwanensis]
MLRRSGTGFRLSAYLFLALAPLLWAGNFVFGRVLVEALPPFGLNLLRWVLACAILAPLALRWEGGIPVPPRRLWPALLGMAVSGVLLFNSLVYLALTETTSINASLINGATPILTIMLAALIGLDRLNGLRVFGAALSLFGVAWIVSRGSPEALLGLTFNRGDVIMLAAALMWAGYTVLARQVMGTLSPLAATTITSLLGLPMLLAVGGYELATQPVGEMTPVVILGLLYVAGGASVAAFLAWNTGIERVGAARGAVFLNLVPVFTAILAVPVLGESLAVAQVAGGLLVICGVTVAATLGRPGSHTKPPRRAR